MRISNQKNHQRNVFKVHLFFEIMATMAISQRSHGRMNFAYQSLLYLLKILRNYPRIIQTNRFILPPVSVLTLETTYISLVEKRIAGITFLT